MCILYSTLAFVVCQAKTLVDAVFGRSIQAMPKEDPQQPIPVNR
jgi:hypothetical protein